MADKFDLDKVRNAYKWPIIVAAGFLVFAFFTSDCFKYCT